MLVNYPLDSIIEVNEYTVSEGKEAKNHESQDIKKKFFRSLVHKNLNSTHSEISKAK